MTSYPRQTLTPEMMLRYLASSHSVPLDEEIRRTFKIPDNRYYSVSRNSHNYGEVRVDHTRTRTVESVKISKSDL